MRINQLRLYTTWMNLKSMLGQKKNKKNSHTKESTQGSETVLKVRVAETLRGLFEGAWQGGGTLGSCIIMNCALFFMDVIFRLS